MSAMIRQLFTISHNTFTQSIRQPILVVLIMIAMLAMVLNPSLAAYTLDDDNKLLLDLGLSTLFLAGLLMAAFTATGVLGTEIHNKTALAVVSKPVARPVFVIGKYLGVSAAMAVAFWVLCMVFLLTVRHRVLQTARDPVDWPVVVAGVSMAVLALGTATLGNYYYRWSFTSTLVISLSGAMTLAWGLVLFIDKQWRFQAITTEFAQGGSLQGGRLLLGLLLIFQAVLILAAVAIAASTRLGQVMTLLVSSGVFLLGLISDSVGVRAVRGLEAADLSVFQAGVWWVARLVYYLAPNLQSLWPADMLTQGHSLTVGYLGLATAYTLSYTAAVLALAVALFQRRELG